LPDTNIYEFYPFLKIYITRVILSNIWFIWCLLCYCCGMFIWRVRVR